jgi:hypothetical protein
MDLSLTSREIETPSTAKTRDSFSQNKSNSTILTEEEKSSSMTKSILEVDMRITENKYINMRLLIIFKLWNFLTCALNSSWSNIRSISYGLICSMLKIFVVNLSSHLYLYSF